MKILKILITGPYNAGKTTLIKTLCSNALTTDKRVLSDELVKSTTTVALDFGLVNIGGTMIRLFGTPGQSRFHFMWRALSIGMDGYIFMVDSSDPTSLNDALHMYMFFRSMHPKKPHVISANKYDKENKLSLDAIRRALKASEDTPIYPTIAYDKESVNRLLICLINLVKSKVAVQIK
ncbi:MAG: GTP-binding protein [Nitrososphaeria archaeon]|nr:GTP-binding protein [Nitrososphaeria archaeon]MDW7986783.1 GTP-binding protein [Nitrososphaerota archaeon]